MLRHNRKGLTAVSDHNDTLSQLGDFTATPRMITISLMAIVIGVVSTFVAFALLRLIGFFTNLFYYGRISAAMVSPASNQLGWLAVLVPVAGGLIIGLMARYGSERIRGHGIPEALESILINGSKVQPRLAILKPLSSAISIGSGGPFGAEGPIIMTGGAIGSIIAQLFQLTSAERKTLLVAGAAAGMSATFAAPVASVLLAVELLLFEWKPRSADSRWRWRARRPARRGDTCSAWDRSSRCLRTSCMHRPVGAAGCVARGIAGRRAFGAADQGVYAAEDLFQKLPDPLDVVARDRRRVGRNRRPDLSAGAGRRLRHHRRAAAGRRAADRDCGRAAGQVDHLDRLAGLGHVGRRAGAVADDGRRRWAASKRMFLPQLAPGFWPLVSMARDARRAPCARRSPASCSRWS